MKKTGNIGKEYNVARKLSPLEQKDLKKCTRKNKEKIDKSLYILSLTPHKCENDIQAPFATRYKGQL